MIDLTTTITINGAEGERFLSSLAGYGAPVPRVLHKLATSERRAIDVDPRDADVVAQFVEELLSKGWIDVDEPPLLFSPRVGDEVVVRCERLVEVARMMVGTAPTWRLILAGTRGKLLGWRERAGEESRAVIEIAGMDKQLVVFVREANVTRAPRR
jgi:hypothetical protein